MALLYSLPHWFFGYGIAFELLFGIITALVAYYAFKVYKLCDYRECKKLGWAFSAISAAYLILPIMQLLAWSQVSTSSYVMTISVFSQYALIGLYLHVFLLLTGFATLTYITLGIASQRIYSLLVTLSIVAVIFSAKVGVAFNFIAALLLFYVLLHYVKRYIQNRNDKALLTTASIAFLFVARVVFAFTTYHPTLYAVSHLLEFAGYTMMMVSLMRILR